MWHIRLLQCFPKITVVLFLPFTLPACVVPRMWKIRRVPRSHKPWACVWVDWYHVVFPSWAPGLNPSQYRVREFNSLPDKFSECLPDGVRNLPIVILVILWDHTSEVIGCSSTVTLVSGPPVSGPSTSTHILC